MINAVDANTAEVVTFNESSSYEDLKVGLIASTSMPFAFPHIYWQDKVLIDGGTIWNLDISNAVKRCKEIVGEKLD